jgi:hypothetical protein
MTHHGEHDDDHHNRDDDDRIDNLEYRSELDRRAVAVDSGKKSTWTNWSASAIER